MIDLTRNRLVTQTADAVHIKIAGIGGAGSNALDRIVLDGGAGAEFLVMNTDVQSLTSSVATQKIQLGRTITRGLGAGGDPELGYDAAVEAAEEIRKAFDGAGMVFLCVGLGGGTGSGAAPVIASLARERGALVVVFATLPFAFEGRRRAQQAEQALATLNTVADAVICFENDRMGDAVPPKAGIHQAFAAADETVSQSVRALATLFARPGLLRIGFDELCTALRQQTPGAGRCLFAYGTADGSNRAHDALARALKSPLMDKGHLLEEAHNVLVNIVGGPDVTLHETETLMTELGKHLSDDAQVLFGASVDPQMTGRLSVTILSSHAIGIDSSVSASPVPVAQAAPSHPVAPASEPKLEARPTNGNGGHATPEIVDAPVEEHAGKHVDEVVPEEEIPKKTEPKPARGKNGKAHKEPAPANAPVNDPSLIQQGSFLGLAPEIPAAAPFPAANPERPARIPRSAPRPIKPELSEEEAAAKIKREERQETLQFEPVTRGRFEKSEPTIVDGQDLDVPTWLRRNVKLK